MFNLIRELFPGALVGTIATGIASLIAKMCSLFITLYATRAYKIKGEWIITTYIRNKIGEFNIDSSKINIRLNLFHKYSIKSSDANGNPYYGTAKTDGGNLILEMCSSIKNYRDYTYHKLSLLGVEKNEIYFGVFISTDYMQRICAGVSFISKSTLTVDKVNELINKYYLLSDNTTAISMK
jgi:hypothetical protein